MLRIVVTPEAEMLANHERHAVRRKLDATAKPQVVGALDAAALLDRREFLFRGRPYRVPPVPWPLAVRMLACQDALRATVTAKPNRASEAEAFASAVRLIKDACHPRGFLRRIFWPLTRNPWLRATPAEVGSALGFFFVCLTLDGSAPSMTPTAPPGISRLPSPASSPATRNGRGQTASRARGATS